MAALEVLALDESTPQILAPQAGDTYTMPRATAVNAGTLTTDVKALDISATWNNAGVVFTGLKFNATDTASNGSSLLIDLQVGGTSKFLVRKDGLLAVYPGHTAIGASSSTMTFYANNYSARAAVTTTGLFAASTMALGFASTSSPTATPDIFLSRIAAGTMALSNSTNACGFQVYNTTDSTTSPTNYERGFMRWNSNALEIGTEAGGTGTIRSLALLFSSGFTLTNPDGATVSLKSGSNWITNFTNTGISLISSASLRFSSSTQYGYSSLDTGLKRASAGVVQVTDGSTGRGDLECADINSNGGVVVMTNLPTSDPLVAGRLWNNSGVLTVSAG